MKALDFVQPAVLALASASTAVGIDPLVANIIIVPLAAGVQALRLSGSNMREIGKAFKPGDVQQIGLTGVASFIVLSIVHYQFPTWNFELGIGVGLGVGWLGMETFVLLKERFLGKKDAEEKEEEK